MASQTAMNNMRLCSNSWPCDYDLFQEAVTKQPQFSNVLHDLLDKVEDGMREKDHLDHRVGQVIGLEVMVAQEWPTNHGLFVTAIVKLNSEEKYEMACELQARWALAAKGISDKKNLDASIVQIIEGTFGGDIEKAHEAWETQNQPGYITPPASPGFMEPPPIQRMPLVVSDVLAQSGAFDDIAQGQKADPWTEDDYKAHCLPVGAGPYDHLTESDWEEWERQQAEHEKNQPWCDYCHPNSNCDGDHGDEMRDGFLLRKGPAFSPLTVARPVAQPVAAPLQQVMPQEQPQEQPQAKPTCGATLKCSWPNFCRCGWQFTPQANVAQFRGGTAKWDSNTESWTWTSTSTSYSSTWSQHFPYEDEQEKEQQQILDYIEEVDAWSRGVERLVAESKAIRQAPLSTFAELAGYKDDDTIPEVDIEAA